MTEKEGYRTKKKGHRLLILLFGIVVGAAAALFLPRYLERYLPQLVSAPAAIEGEVMDKEVNTARVVLKVSTTEGVLLASFTEMQNEVDLLVEEGDSIMLEADRYQPFMENPAVLSVQKPGRKTRTAGGGVSAEREAYQKRMEAQLDAWEEEIAELEAKAGELGEDVQQEYEQQLDVLRRRRDVARQKLEELKDASAAAWEELKVGVDRAWDELREALDTAMSRFEDPTSAES